MSAGAPCAASMSFSSVLRSAATTTWVSARQAHRARPLQPLYGNGSVTKRGAPNNIPILTRPLPSSAPLRAARAGAAARERRRRGPRPDGCGIRCQVRRRRHRGGAPAAATEGGVRAGLAFTPRVHEHAAAGGGAVHGLRYGGQPWRAKASLSLLARLKPLNSTPCAHYCGYFSPPLQLGILALYLKDAHV